MKITTVIVIPNCTKEEAEKVGSYLTEGAKVTVDDVLGAKAYDSCIVTTEVAEAA